jgi:hypothetical protein
MSEKERYQIAKDYIDRQIKKLERRGSITKKISNQKYKELIKQTAQATNS